ncbi:hypothetical protein [Enterococcus sp. AZ163]|uniref:hypothetical protein n=1 Tax=Enterococcus sp. AZ163 TaxID=2774638 RepID=UPI003D2B3875
MIIDTELVNQMFRAKTSREISELSGISERTIQKYKSSELNWLGKHSKLLGLLAAGNTDIQYVRNVNSGTVMLITDYIDLIIRETIEAWNDLDPDEKEEDYDNSIEVFYNSYNEIDSDFQTSDKDGNELSLEDQAWNDQTIAYQYEQIKKLVEQYS